MWKVIGVSNFETPTESDVLVREGLLDRDEAQRIADDMNFTSMTSLYYYVVRNQNHVLRLGSEWL